MSKLLLVLSVALFATLIVFNNVVDYGTNFAFVHHVLHMDTVFSTDQAAWRGISSPIVHHVAYVFIILWESLIAVLCWIGSTRLWRQIHDAEGFEAAKEPATAGLVAGILLWFTGFVVVGGEWFLMWQSTEWNGLQTSREFALILGVIAIYLNMPDRSRNVV